MPRIALVSTAHIHTRGFIENLRSSGDGRQLVALWDDPPERGEALAAELGCRWQPELEALAADPEVDGFLICSETCRHLELLTNLLPAGKPVFCDKPLVVGAKELKKLRKLFDGCTTPVVTGYFLPCFGDHQAIRNLLKGRFFGEVTRVRFRNAHAAAYQRWFSKPGLDWFVDPAQSGGGGFLDMGTHAAQLLRFLFGPVTEVSAVIRNESGAYPEVDDFGLAFLKFESGVLGTIEGGWTQTGGPRLLEIVGSEKTLWHDGVQYRIEGPQFPQETLLTITGVPSRVDRLVAAVRGELAEEAWREELEAALDAVAILDACYRSSEKRKAVAVG